MTTSLVKWFTLWALNKEGPSSISGRIYLGHELFKLVVVLEYSPDENRCFGTHNTLNSLV